MKRQIVLLCVAFSIEMCLSEQSAQMAVSPGARIIKGHPADLERYKFQVSIRLKRSDFKFGNGHLCGGALIGLRKVVTAAHCFYNFEKERFRSANEFIVVMGTVNRFRRVNGTIVSEVTSIVYMNTFRTADMRDDIAVMFLKTGLPANKTHLTVAPIALASRPAPVGAKCHVSGWGQTENAPLSPILRTANVTIIRRSLCAKSYRLLDGMICAGHIAGGIDSCQGDSGGPLVYNDTLVGIVSWGNKCALPLFPGVYSDVFYYRDWIDGQNAGFRITWSALGLVLALISAHLLQ